MMQPWSLGDYTFAEVNAMVDHIEQSLDRKPGTRKA
jgi:hypothetical protein